MGRNITLTPKFLCLSFILLLTIACVEKRPPQSVDQVSSVSRKLEQMVEEDQALRTNDTLDYSIVHRTGQQHRRAVYRLLAEGSIRRGEDLHNAALILQHADPSSCTECYLLAHHLALEAVDQGYSDARYLVAQTLDRFLVMSKKPQKYGTQYNIDSLGEYYLFPVDTAISDSERAKWDVPPLDSIEVRIDRLNQP